MIDAQAGDGRSFLIAYQGDYDWPSMHAWLSARAIAGLEEVHAEGYVRTFRHDGATGVVQAAHRPERQAFEVRLRASGPIDVAAMRARLTRVLDLDRDIAATTAHYVGDPWLAALAARHRGLRVPGGWDPFELAVRAVLGQQVTIGAARALVSRLVAQCRASAGPAAERCEGFPTPADVLAADLTPLGMPGARKATLQSLAHAALTRADLFRTGDPLDDTIARLRSVRGIGDWTAHYIALRALRVADAFPASDVGLLRGAACETGVRPSPRELLRRADAWRPHRAYAAQLLWAEDGASLQAEQRRVSGGQDVERAGAHRRTRP